MDKRMVVLVFAVSLAGSAHAFPIEAIGSLFAKLFKSGATKEAGVAGRSAEGAAGAKGLEHIPSGNAAKASPAAQSVEPTPDMVADVVAQNRKDAETYKNLRDAAGRGDTTAMLKMYEMTESGRVSDLGEPWRGYWLFNAARLGSRAAIQKSHDECSNSKDRRASDRWFDSACGAADGQRLYIGKKLPRDYTTYRSDYPTNSAQQQGTK